MKRKAVSGIMLTLMFMMLLAPWTRLDMPVVANPIPVPTLIMPEEYINVTLSSGDGKVLTKVNGTYPFVNINYSTVKMDYPVPPNATSISVEMNGTSLDWTYNTKVYSTVIGDWPMINWTISPVPSHFEVKTYYEHPVPLIGNNYMFLYAMGTGRYLETYAKETTAYVRIRMETNYTALRVYTVGNVSGEWVWKSVSYTIIRENTTDIITLNVTSQQFEPLKEDLLLTFSTDPTAVLWDLNNDGIVDIFDLVIWADAFGAQPEDPKWNPQADLYPDNVIDIFDGVILAYHFGETV